MTISNGDVTEWAFKVGDFTIIKCWSCELHFDLRAIDREDGFCPCCKAEVDYYDEPYEPLLKQL